MIFPGIEKFSSLARQGNLIPVWKSVPAAAGKIEIVEKGRARPFVAMRYHSLVVDPGSIPPELEVSASTAEGVVMGLRHRSLFVEGVQFHPESILTKVGHQLLKNFLGLVQAG